MTIAAGVVMTSQEYQRMLTAIVNEYTRRSYSTTGITTTFSTAQASGTTLRVLHPNGILSDINSFPSSGKTYTTYTAPAIISTATIQDAIAFIQAKMNQIARK